ncbi:IPT/TIG domain-containing protein [Mucilaginibacter sp. HMF5004]|uniref:IPT/TIG domain-containing protein n=1 Tax=Mucilaginibacter rivuli TaxID=2857527 RepID=UPI001C5F26E6|nr:IPT/TIG domain-containing protein [Mucilaginibacter rivuli]MBW4890560.1 IPT/TIG domain-containing protein [Mucilaginibacter rivuli]
MKKITLPSAVYLFVCFLLSITVSSCKKDQSGTTPADPPPTITSISPKNPMPGDVVTITGTGFGSVATDVKVTIGTQVITITTVSDTQIKFTLPANITAGDLALAIKNITAANADPQGVTITPQPAPAVVTVLSISPAQAKVGDVVTVLGTGFSTTVADNVFKFNGAAAVVQNVVLGSMQVVVPAGATTGPVSLSVKGGATVTGPQFTLDATTTGNSVDYINVISGTAKFSKLLTANDDICDIFIDKNTNTLYYSDYYYLGPSATNTIYKMNLAGGSPTKLTTDARITNIQYITTDASGNIFALKYQDNAIQKATIYKISVDGVTITEIKKDIALFGDGAKRLYVDSQGTIWLGHSNKLDASNNYVYVSSHNANSAVDGPLYKGDQAYVANYTTYDIVYKSLNLVSGTDVTTDFTLQSMFKQDDAAITSNGDGPRLSQYALDGSENCYVIYPLSYQSGQLTQTYLIRKTKNGSGTSSLITKFNTKYSATNNIIEPQGLLRIKPVIAADNAGNLYLKYNSKEIIKIVQ